MLRYTFFALEALLTLDEDQKRNQGSEIIQQHKIVAKAKNLIQ